MADSPSQETFGTREKLAYAAGYLGVSLLTFAVTQWLQSYYIPTTGGEPLLAPMTWQGQLLTGAQLFGILMVLAKVIDGLADPLAGYLSDTARTPIGRRRPFLLLFGPLAGLAFVMLYPRLDAGQVAPARFLITVALYYLFYTLAVTPYLAFLPEVATSAKARLGLTTYQTVFNFIGIATAMILGGQLRDNPAMAPILGTVGGLALMLPGLLLRERPRPARTADEKAPSLAGMFGELWTALQNRLFLQFVLSQLCMWFGFNLILAWMPYLVERILRGSSTTTANLAALGTALVLLPISYRVVTKLGKPRGLMLAMGLFAIGFLILSQLGALPAPPLDLEKVMAKRAEHGHATTLDELKAGLEPVEYTGDPATPNQRWPVGLAILCCLGFPLSIFFLVPNAILAEVIDLDKAASGQEREGMFFAAQAVVIQSGGALSAGLGAFIMTEGGTAATLAGIARVGPVAALIVGLGVVILARFATSLAKATRFEPHRPPEAP